MKLFPKLKNKICFLSSKTTQTLETKNDKRRVINRWEQIVVMKSVLEKNTYKQK